MAGIRASARFFCGHLTDSARAVGIRRLVAETLAENHHMLDMFAHAGLPLTRTLDRGVVTVTMTLVARPVDRARTRRLRNIAVSAIIG